VSNNKYTKKYAIIFYLKNLIKFSQIVFLSQNAIKKTLFTIQFSQGTVRSYQFEIKRGYLVFFFKKKFVLFSNLAT